MTERVVAPFGTWASPISAGMVARGSVWLSEPLPSGDATYWLEARPIEEGRHVIARSDPWGGPTDVTPTGFSARDRVHEYGGGSYTVDGSTIFFSNDDDQRVYRQALGAEPAPVTPVPTTHRGLRYADLQVSPDSRSIVCVRERHEGEGLPANQLVVFAADGSAEPVVIATDRDFYAAPRFAPDGERLAWIEWDMPQMPWDGTELKVADVGEGGLGSARHIAGSASESVVLPAWSPDGRLHFISDRTGWWNLYREEPDGSHAALAPLDAEFAVPMWEFGYSTYAFLSDGRIACIYRTAGVHHLAMLDPASGELLDLDLPYECFEPYLRAEGSRLVFLAGGPRTPMQVVTLDFTTRSVDVLRESERLEVDTAYLSEPEPIEFPTEGGRTAFAYYYPPVNPGFEAQQGERPPLVVTCHGGPTSEVTPELDLDKQYLTSRGFAVVDVNYGGSTGYDREFRERMYGQWGVVDVQDCAAAARSLVERAWPIPTGS